MKEKIIRVLDPREVVYSKAHFELLDNMRTRAIGIMKLFNARSLLYGSVARGDVNSKSDVDIVFQSPIESYMLEINLENQGIMVVKREIMLANPNSVPKAHLHLEDDTTLTFPLFKPGKNEEEFYSFGGSIDISDIKSGKRVCGITKKLVFIDPTEKGHVEYSIIGREVEVSKKLGLSQETVLERIRVLTRRDRIGRTGVYLKEELDPESTFEATWKYLADRNPVLRRQWKIRKRS